MKPVQKMLKKSLNGINMFNNNPVRNSQHFILQQPLNLNLKAQKKSFPEKKPSSY
jgi:hypothetical protein